MPSLQEAYNYIVEACNDPYTGYSQDEDLRNRGTRNGITYYDCSSLMWFGLSNGGFDVGTSAWYTGDQVSRIKAAGWVEVDRNGPILPGDIGWYRHGEQGHTEMCYIGGVGRGVFMGAHTYKVALVNQVSIGSSSGDANATRPGTYWDKIFRWPEGPRPVPGGAVTVEWKYGTDSEYFTDYGDNARNNAAIILGYFLQKGWSLEAIAALCGNIQGECRFNPALKEQPPSDAMGHDGRGLVQWTTSRGDTQNPLYTVLDVLYGEHSDWHDGTKQLEVLYAEFEESTGLEHRGIEPQWYPVSGYSMTWKAWSESTADVGYLATAFERNYLRPAAHHPEREGYARQWYSILKTLDPLYPGDPSPGGDPRGAHHMPVWMMVHRR